MVKYQQQWRAEKGCVMVEISSHLLPKWEPNRSTTYIGFLADGKMTRLPWGLPHLGNSGKKHGGNNKFPQVIHPETRGTSVFKPDPALIHSLSNPSALIQTSRLYPAFIQTLSGPCPLYRSGQIIVIHSKSLS